MNHRIWFLLAAVLVTVISVFLFPAIPQSEAYHNFADKRALLGIPNCLDVISNALFLVVGLPGMGFALRDTAERGPRFLDSRERWPYFTFFAAVTLTAFGSAWYHLRPNDHTLVWDRIPMAIGFMSLVAAVVAERINVKAGVRLLLPLITVGIGSVIYWDVTQSRGHGDLRPYAIAQFGSLLVLSLIFVLFPARYTRTADFAVSLALYGVAKVFEAADRLIFSLGGFVSGHTIKHIFAALSAYWILRMLRLRVPIRTDSSST
ncbi:MAG: alkaline phytoceramidase [Acidobacteriia bacterium]|nr:alkaline phytoceramidase [Terriglobia bacterium]